MNGQIGLLQSSLVCSTFTWERSLRDLCFRFLRLECTTDTAHNGWLRPESTPILGFMDEESLRGKALEREMVSDLRDFRRRGYAGDMDESRAMWYGNL